MSGRCPGCVSPALVNRLPLAGGAQTGGIEFEGIDPKATKLGNVDYRSVTPDYFRALRDPASSAAARSPRAISETAPPVAIIDERLARRFAGADPVGRRVRIPVATCPG